MKLNSSHRLLSTSTNTSHQHNNHDWAGWKNCVLDWVHLIQPAKKTCTGCGSILSHIFRAKFQTLFSNCLPVFHIFTWTPCAPKNKWMWVLIEDKKRTFHYLSSITQNNYLHTFNSGWYHYRQLHLSMNKRQKNPVLIELRGTGETGGQEPRRLGVGVVRETGEERVGSGSLHW